MIETLEWWMSETTGLVVKLDSPEIANYLYDGSTFYEILCKYDVIDRSKYPEPPKNASPQTAKRTLFKLGLWFKLLGVTQSRETLEAVSNKDPHVCVTLLFDLYSKLYMKGYPFLTRQKAEETQQNYSDNFASCKVRMEPLPPLSPPSGMFYIEAPLRDKREIVDKYKMMTTNLENTMKNYMIERREAVKKWDAMKTLVPTNFEASTEKNRHFDEDPIDIFTAKTRSIKGGPLNVDNKDFVAYLKQKRRKTTASYLLKSKMEEILIDDLWSQLTEEKDQEFANIFQKILVKPCNYENKLMATLHKLHDNCKTFTDFTDYVDNLIESRISLAESLYRLDKSYRKERTKEIEMNRVLELHRRLYEEKLKTKRDKHTIYCKYLVQDLVDYAIKKSEHVAKFNTAPSKSEEDEWKELFFNELPVLREPRSFIPDLLKYDQNSSMKILVMEVMEEHDLEEDENTNLYQEIPAVIADVPIRSFCKRPESITIEQISKPSSSIRELKMESKTKVLLSPKTSMKWESREMEFEGEFEPQFEEIEDPAYDSDIVDCLNNFNLKQYLKLEGIWDLKQWPDLWPDIPFNEQLNVIGFAVHRLLDLKYTLPKGPKPPKLPPFKIKAVLEKIRDPKRNLILERLTDLLLKGGVQVINPLMAVNYCLKVYNSEKEITEIGSMLKQLKCRKDQVGTVGKIDSGETQRYKKWVKRQSKMPEKPPKRDEEDEPQVRSQPQEKRSKSKFGSRSSRKSMKRKSVARKSVSRKSVARKSVARKSVSRKSVARKSLKRQSVARKSLSRNASKGSKRSQSSKSGRKIPRPAGTSKATQMPSLPDLSKRYKHSKAGKLGKVAFEILAEGKSLNDALLANILIEYLKTLDDKIGFVLVDFPTTALQANALEYQFNGLPLKYFVRPNSEVDLFESDFPQWDVFSHLRTFLEYETMLQNYVKEPEPPLEIVEEEAEVLDTSKLPDQGNDKNSPRRKSSVRKSVSAKKSRKSLARKSVSRKSKSISRKSKIGRKSKISRKSVVRAGRKSVAGTKSKPSTAKFELEKPLVPQKSSEEPSPPKPSYTLEQLNILRISEIVPRPNKNLDDLVFGSSSYFNKYVRFLLMRGRQMKKSFDQMNYLSREEVEPYFLYKNLDIVVDFDYSRLDETTIKRLARVILDSKWDEDDPTRVPSIDLFGVERLERLKNDRSPSDRSSSSDASRASFYESKPQKFQKLNEERVVYKTYDPVKPVKPIEVRTDAVEMIEPSVSLVGTGKKSKSQSSRRSSRKSIKRQSVKRKSRSSMKRQSKASTKRQSVKRKSRASMKRQSKASTKRQSVKRKSRISTRRSSAVKKSTGKTASKVSAVSKDEIGKSLSLVTPSKPKPGEIDWIYVEEPIHYEIGYTAATLWEVVENLYLENMENIFYLLREQGKQILPYSNRVKTALIEAMNDDDDEKQRLVTNFQLMLNKLEDDIRLDVDVKREMHVRVKELQNLMTNCLLKKQQESSAKKREMIAEGWLITYLYTLANLYLRLMQEEINLFVDGLQVINDYYMGILGETPPSQGKLSQRIVVGNPRVPMEEEILLSKLSTTDGKKKRKMSGKTSAAEMALQRAQAIPAKIQEILTKSNSIQLAGTWNPTHPLVSLRDSLKAKTISVRNAYEGIIRDPQLGANLRGIKLGQRAKEKKELTPDAGKSSKMKSSKTPSGRRQSKKQSVGGRRASKRKSTGGRRQSKRQSAAGGGRRKSKRQSTSSRRGSKRKSAAGSKRKSAAGSKRQSSIGKHSKRSESKRSGDDEEPDMVDVLKEEWLAAVNHQSSRTDFRIQLIEARAKKNLDEVMDGMKNLFADYQTQMDAQLTNELKAIEDCMYVFKMAIEEGSSIQPMMVMEKDKFFIDKKILLFPDPPPPPPTPLEETRNPYEFTVEQLNSMTTKFAQMAPTGLVETPMIQILDAMAIAGHESGKPALPSAWAQLDSFDYKDIFVSSFADQTCIDWRHFVINVSNLQYPTVDELIRLKSDYKIRDPTNEQIICRKDFETIPLWFENEFGQTLQDDLKSALSKTLIFKMFKINDNELNYYDMLTNFCRAQDPEDGLGMALDLLANDGYILPPDKCLREDEFDKINPRKIVDYVLVHFTENLLDLCVEVPLKYLPRLNNFDVFGGEENEFEIAEDILRRNVGLRKNYGDLSSTDSETNRPKPERELFLDDDDEMPAKYATDKWQMCVPYEIALSLIVSALNYYSISPIHQHRFLQIERRLRHLYADKGADGFLKAYRLTSSPLFKELYDKTNIFKKTNVIQLAKTIIDNKKQESKPLSALAKD